MSPVDPVQQGGGQTPPGWYPSSPGWQRYWDGSQWTEHQAPLAHGVTSDERTMALLIHLGGAFASILVPIILYVVKKDESPFIRHHALEAINFHITVFIAVCVSFLLMLVLVGFVLLLVVGLGFYVLSIVAAIAANKGEWYRYPMTIRMFN